MAVPAQLVAESVGDGYLKIVFKQGEKEMPADNITACVVLRYPRQGEMMRMPGDPTATEVKATRLNELLVEFNALLESWCS